MGEVVGREPPRGQEGWARDWLAGVAEARKAIERARRIVEARRERACSFGNPLAGSGGRGGTNASEARLVSLVEAEEELDGTYAWARAELEAFDAMAATMRQGLRGQLLDGLDVAEMKYRVGATDRETARAFQISRSKLHADLGVFCDYLDYVGRQEAMGPPAPRHDR